MARDEAATRMFGPPSRGVMRSLPEHGIDPASLYAASNVFYGQGILRLRPGFTKASSSPGAPSDPAFGEIPVGIGWANTLTGNFDVYVAAETNLWRLRNGTGSWTDISGAVTLTAGSTDRARWTTIYNKGTDETAFLFATGTDPLVRSLNGANFTAITGVDNAQDICTCAARVIQVFTPNLIKWSDIYNSGTWPSLNFVYQGDTPGRIVACRNLGTLGVAIYKEDCIIVGYSQPGSPAAAFRWETRVMRPGPASKNAVVDAEGIHYYMTPRGRIASFDGTNFSWIGDGAWPFLFDDATSGFDFFNAYQTTGFYDPGYGIVVFIYPTLADNGSGPTGLAIVTLPRPEWGVESYGIWPGTLSWPVASATQVFYTSGQFALVCRRLTPFMVNFFDNAVTADQGTNFNWSFQTGLQSVRGVQEVTKMEIEAFLARNASYGSATLEAITSHILGSDAGGSVSSSQTIDLTATTLVRDVKGFDVTGRFLGLRVSGASNTGVPRYKGAIVSAYSE
mgnify:CR=1 FL=1